jgi:hypothetical protein
MARGGYGGGAGIPLRDRVRSTTPAAPAATPVALASAGRDDCPARHCWVAVPVDGSRPRPGLLLEWRKVERGRFEGLVTYAAQLRPGRWTTVTEWVPAELLSQADTPNA